MKVTDPDLDRIPVGNIRVSRDLFAAVWRGASARDSERGTRGITDWYAGAVASTCTWIACAPVRSERGRGRLARSPATRKPGLAYEELIEEEFLLAERLEELWPDLAARPGWCEAVRATLRWAWRGTGPAPIDLADVEHAQASTTSASSASEVSTAP